MNIGKDKVSNSVHFSQSPWQYTQGPFYTPVKSTNITLMATTGISREQILCRLYLLFPRIARQEIHRLFRMYNEDTLRTIDTLLYSQMRRITRIKAKKPQGQCARTCAEHRRKKKSFNWRTIKNGTVYNVQQNSPVPQVQRVLDNYSVCLSAARYRNVVANATFDNNGIKNIVFEPLKPRGGDGVVDDKSDIENQPPHKHETRTSILDSPGQMETVLRPQLLDSNGTNTTRHRHSLKMKLSRNGDNYSATIIPD